MRSRKFLLYLFVLTPFLILLSRAFVLQVIQYKTHREYIDSLKVYVRRLEAPRGRILTRDGTILAWDEEVVTAKAVGAINTELVEQVLGKEKMLQLIQGDEIIISETEAQRLEKSGLMISRKLLRRYSGLASHVVGYVDQSRQGISGVEAMYNSYLKGVDGYELISIDIRGRILGRFVESPAIRGNDVVLTIDSKLQSYVEELLARHGKPGAIIVQSVKTGEILAMASYPIFDPNVFAQGVSARQWAELVNDPSSPLLNRAIGGLYPPGSVIKPLYAIALLEEADFDIPSINCLGYFEYVGTTGRVLGTYRDWYLEGHGETDLKKAIKVSCNVYFYNLALHLGIERMKQIASFFRIDELTQIDLPGERKGLFPDPTWKYERFKEPWYPGDTILCGIGQSFILVTPLEITSFYNAIANGGTCYQPRLLKSILDFRGKKVYEPDVTVLYKVSMKKSTHEFLVSALREVVQSANGGTPRDEGTAYRAFRGLKMDVAAKTGTAETGKSGQLPHSWFAGFAPASNPEILVVVLLENSGSGGEAAAPLARKVFEYWGGKR
ncbi:penicillin-binding transpeptidase domain-containing protein [Pseudothermotoga thermarum]|uniref:Penicillin-binding protein 2 n=1 Tax=Pseudothermotoga thermarum DSM 5069 TaxID=688269 RepID=F7YXH1_9THEM|nr:penicillin-binding transpeptidase domain-containing protein [Pseudothermotoga thermarum]AEH52015.1 penicillin-binding protein 2 [Pseudothermotoga thermarum DSM 5069]